jgi:hypothetical protein
MSLPWQVRSYHRDEKTIRHLSVELLDFSGYIQTTLAEGMLRLARMWVLAENSRLRGASQVFFFFVPLFATPCPQASWWHPRAARGAVTRGGQCSFRFEFFRVLSLVGFLKMTCSHETAPHRGSAGRSVCAHNACD